ncbi:MAG: hypothetical protein BA864_00390 [Desulfuromonadales bacterium C00003093]|nr:MAG: hypothetical protein BA864_00390 [Desulfuromonadales bacterium C00003093]
MTDSTAQTSELSDVMDTCLNLEDPKSFFLFAGAGSGKTRALVEAMKMFNEIEAEFKCKIVEIVKDDAAPVEYGETLFLVERL